MRSYAYDDWAKNYAQAYKALLESQMAQFKDRAPDPKGVSIADKVLNDQNPGSAKTRNGNDVGGSPNVDLRRPVASGERAK